MNSSDDHVVKREKSERRNDIISGWSCTFALLIAALVFNGIVHTIRTYNSSSYWITTSPSNDYADGALETKLILAWNSFFANQYFGCEGSGIEPFRNCAEPNCYITTDRSLVTKATAILFHIPELDNFPQHRTPNQVYVFYMRESASFVGSHDYLGNGKNLRKVHFNLTMTYRRDSDIPLPMGQVYKLPSTGVKKEPYRLKFPFSSRKRSVAWVVSHCETGSKRELYTKRLQRYIDIDVYGRCGTRSCKPNTRSFFTDIIPSKYKFYLPFENSICKDYVTEKLFRALQTEIVPIVLGGTNYSRDAPPHSYINVLDYKSPSDLAAYLRRLSRNETEYLKYFQWKNSYFASTNQISRGCCKLCDFLNTQSFHKTYDDVMDWWSRGMCDNDLLARKRAKRWQNL